MEITQNTPLQHIFKEWQSKFFIVSCRITTHLEGDYRLTLICAKTPMSKEELTFWAVDKSLTICLQNVHASLKEKGLL